MTNEFEAPTENEYEDRVIILAKYLETDIDNIADGYTDNVYDTDDGEYMILDNDEANDMATGHIEDSLWAFNADFIIDHTDLPYDAIEMIQSYQKDKYEDANETIRALINDMDEFVYDAICADGRGHFINSYDDEEIEAGNYYIYRMG